MKLRETRKCAECGDVIVGRTDKKYCGDQCRFLANNRKKTATEWPILELNKTLRKNRSILKTLCPVGRSVVRKEVLDALQYDGSVFSSIYVTARKQIYYLCYEYGFTPIMEKGEKKVLIISRQPYMDKWDPWKFVYKDPKSAE